MFSIVNTNEERRDSSDAGYIIGRDVRRIQIDLKRKIALIGEGLDRFKDVRESPVKTIDYPISKQLQKRQKDFTSKHTLNLSVEPNETKVKSEVKVVESPVPVIVNDDNIIWKSVQMKKKPMLRVRRRVNTEIKVAHECLEKPDNKKRRISSDAQEETMSNTLIKKRNKIEYEVDAEQEYKDVYTEERNPHLSRNYILNLNL